MLNPKFAGLNFDAIEILSKEQQRKVLGGDGGAYGPTSPPQGGSPATPPSYPPPGSNPNPGTGGGYPYFNTDGGDHGAGCTQVSGTEVSEC